MTEPKTHRAIRHFIVALPTNRQFICDTRQPFLRMTASIRPIPKSSCDLVIPVVRLLTRTLEKRIYREPRRHNKNALEQTLVPKLYQPWGTPQTFADILAIVNDRPIFHVNSEIGEVLSLAMFPRGRRPAGPLCASSVLGRFASNDCIMLGSPRAEPLQFLRTFR